MKSNNGKAVIIGIILFGLLIAAAIYLQSAYLLYAASGVPILLVPFLPDLSVAQTIRPGRTTASIRMYRTSPLPGDGFLVIEAAPGAIHWNKERLFFALEGVPVHAAAGHPSLSAGLAVLQYDLIKHRRKKNTYGIELAHLKDRLSTLPYTSDEVTRLVIRMEDLAAMDPAYTASRTAQVRKGLEA